MVDGWDISIDNIGDAMRKAKVLDIALQDQVYDKLSKLVPRPSIYDSDFIAANQVRHSINIKCKKLAPILSIAYQQIHSQLIYANCNLIYILSRQIMNCSRHVQRMLSPEQDTSNMNRFDVTFVTLKPNPELIRSLFCGLQIPNDFQRLKKVLMKRLPNWRHL